MEIHKPKAAHSWREFLTEIGTIVCGILIALGLEQAVEWSHWQHVVVEQRERIEAERSRMLGAMNARAGLEACITRRLNDIGLLLDRHDGGRPLNLQGQVGRPVYYNPSTAAWTTAIANQAVSHMPAAEQAYLARSYSDYDVYTSVTKGERDAWRNLEILDYAPRLTPQDWSDVRRAFLAARDADVIMDNALKDTGLSNWVKSFRNVRPAAFTDVRTMAQVVDLCRPMIDR